VHPAGRFGVGFSERLPERLRRGVEVAPNVSNELSNYCGADRQPPLDDPGSFGAPSLAIDDHLTCFTPKRSLVRTQYRPPQSAPRSARPGGRHRKAPRQTSAVTSRGPLPRALINGAAGTFFGCRRRPLGRGCPVRVGSSPSRVVVLTGWRAGRRCRWVGRRDGGRPERRGCRCSAAGRRQN
jgi:hypothetical protein